MLVDGALGNKVRFHWRGAGRVNEPVLALSLSLSFSLSVSRSLSLSLPLYLSISLSLMVAAEEPVPRRFRSVGWMEEQHPGGG